MKKIILVFNKKSGSALSLQELKKLFRKYNYEVVQAIDISRKDFNKKLRKIASQKQIIAAVGGDGTLSGVANIIAGGSATLLPLPGGTLNNFTKDLGIPQDIERALARTTKIKPRSIDVGRVNGIVFLNNSSIGLYPQSLNIRKELEVKVSKWPAAAFASAWAFLRFRTYTITVNGKATFKTPFIFIGNNRYRINDFALTNRTHFNEGVLCVYAINATSRLVFAKLFFAILRGKLHHVDEFRTLSTRSLSIATRHKKTLSVSHDGEVTRLQSPLEYQSAHDSLRILG